jgi:hypothetical protein
MPFCFSLRLTAGLNFTPVSNQTIITSIAFANSYFVGYVTTFYQLLRLFSAKLGMQVILNCKSRRTWEAVTIVYFKYIVESSA